MKLLKNILAPFLAIIIVWFLGENEMEWHSKVKDLIDYVEKECVDYVSFRGATACKTDRLKTLIEEAKMELEEPMYSCCGLLRKMKKYKCPHGVWIKLNDGKRRYWCCRKLTGFMLKHWRCVSPQNPNCPDPWAIDKDK